MNIVLACSRFPRAARERSATEHVELASALAALGHAVHLLWDEPRPPGLAPGVAVVPIPRPPRINQFSATERPFDYALNYSQLVHECLLRIKEMTGVHVVDVPLQGATGLVSLLHHRGPVVLRVSDLSDSFDSDPAEGLLAECVRRAAGILVTSPELLEWARRSGAACDDAFMRVVPPDAAGSAAASADLYDALARELPRRARQDVRTVVQVMDVLDYGDAVTSIALRNADCLAEVGGESRILTNLPHFTHALMRHRQERLDAAELTDRDAVLVHYWGYSELEDFLRGFRGPTAVHYHNITPPTYFSIESRDRVMTTAGYEQLGRIAGWFDLVIGDSEYNLDQYALHLHEPRVTLCVYPTIELSALRALEADADLLEALKAPRGATLLFVGRIARNKRQDLVMRVFDSFNSQYDPDSRLFLVGSHEQNTDYRRELEDLRRVLSSGERIYFTGKVSDAAVRAYYRSADVFVSASEHEGFGMPVVEAMAYDIPVVALACTAVGEAMGEGGVGVREWDEERVAGEVDHVLRDSERRSRLIGAQRANLARFSRAEARQRIAEAVDFLRHGTIGPHMSWRGAAARAVGHGPSS